MTKSNQQGFSPVVILLLVALLALVGFAGWRIYSQNEQSTQTGTSSQQNSDPVPQVENAQDLEKAEGYLKDSDIDKELDTNEIDSAINE